MVHDGSYTSKVDPTICSVAFITTYISTGHRTTGAIIKKNILWTTIMWKAQGILDRVRHIVDTRAHQLYSVWRYRGIDLEMTWNEPESGHFCTMWNCGVPFELFFWGLVCLPAYSYVNAHKKGGQKREQCQLNCRGVPTMHRTLLLGFFSSFELQHNGFRLTKDVLHIVTILVLCDIQGNQTRHCEVHGGRVSKYQCADVIWSVVIYMIVCNNVR